MCSISPPGGGAVHRLVHVAHQQEVLQVDDLVQVLVLELPDVDPLPDG
jgi:hypothetical protein